MDYVCSESIQFLGAKDWLYTVVSSLDDCESSQTELCRINSFLIDCYDTALIDYEELCFGNIILDAVSMGYFKNPIGFRCQGIEDCNSCRCYESCSIYYFYSKLYCKQNKSDSESRLCAFLKINFPGFSSDLALDLNLGSSDFYLREMLQHA